MTCPVCRRPCDPDECTPTGFGLTCWVCVEKGEGCAPKEDE